MIPPESYSLGFVMESEGFTRSLNNQVRLHGFLHRPILMNHALFLLLFYIIPVLLLTSLKLPVVLLKSHQPIHWTKTQSLKRHFRLSHHLLPCVNQVFLPTCHPFLISEVLTTGLSASYKQHESFALFYLLEVRLGQCQQFFVNQIAFTKGSRWAAGERKKPLNL